MGHVELRAPMSGGIPDADWILARLEDGHSRELYDWLHALPGHYRLQLPGRIGGSTVLVANYAQATEILKDPKRFSSTKGVFVHPEIYRRWGGRIRRFILENLNSSDPPQHGRYRRVVAPAFGAAAIKTREERFRKVVYDIMDAILVSDRPHDLADLGLDLTRWSMDEVFGIAPDKHEAFLLWSRYLVAGRPVPGYSNAIEAAKVSREIVACAAEVLREAAGRSGDAMADVCAAAARGEITSEEAESYFLLLVIAGAQTTAQTLVQGLLGFAQQPDQYARLRSQPELIPNAVEEIIRWSAAAKQFHRTVTMDTEIGGTSVRAGEVVGVLFGAANRDPHVFPDGHLLDVSRKNARAHLSLGGGPHFCLGSWLAKMELEVFFSALVEKVAAVELVEPPVWQQSPHLAGLQSLRLILHPAKGRA